MEEGELLTLLERMAESCKVMNRARVDDVFGSSTDTWTEGSSFNATIVKNSSTEATIAEKQGVSEIFTVVTARSSKLGYHDVFKRVSDGQIFRVTSEAIDSEAPDASTVQICKVTAEKWVIPSA